MAQVPLAAFSAFANMVSPLSVPLWGVLAQKSNTSCDVASFQALSLPNIEILKLNVTASYGEAILAGNAPVLAPDAQLPATVDICRIEIQYTHPGQSDSINTYIGLPLDSSSWNSRFIMVGGGGWLAGSQDQVTVPVASGFTSSSTDGGHTPQQQTSDWGLASEGNTNWPALVDFSSVAIVEAARLGKQATRIYYGSAPKYSYWTGCSTGGRQGHMMAQRYPEEFDGIIGGAPAFNWQEFIPAEFWPFMVANFLDVQPPPCVLNAFTEAAISACDALDGVEDGIISLPEQCKFSALTLVGSTVECSDPVGSVTITDNMARLVDATWTGTLPDVGTSGWYSLHQDAPLVSLLNTTCTSIDNCTVRPFQITGEWLQTFLARNSSFDLYSVTPEDYVKFRHQSIDEYASIIGTDNADLTNLRRAGTKLIAWHGMQDQLIPPNGTIDYYQRVLDKEVNGNVTDYYRLFMAPGVEHCGAGQGFDPNAGLFVALQKWVETGIAPETLTGVAAAVASGNSSKTRSAGLCLYPSVLTYVGDDPNDAASFTCH